ncbi:HAMP domain-containing sensor histidine kinase [Rathayibacter sp. YIM 133350]|uniref:sensor histidine kinase n=1 Tax=Rathayibacter sp. YIM 133350 TaxID=3131992 RepID=UPI00307E286F
MDGFRLRDAARSVRARIVVSILLVTAIGMAVAGAVTIFVQRERVLAQVDVRLTQTADNIREAAATAPSGGAGPMTVRELLAAAMSRVVPDHNESTVGIVDGRAALVPASDVAFRLDRDDAFIDGVIANADPRRVVIGTTDAAPGTLRYVIVPVSVDGVDQTGLYVSAYNVSAELEEVRDAFTTYAVVVVLALFIIGLVGWVVSGRLLAPIRSLRETAARISGSDLSERIPVDGTDDVSDLTRTVNGMLDRLEHSFVSQRRLLDDVSHELKTPLTIVRGHLELMDANAPDDVRVTREIAINELDRMDTLVVDIGLLVKSGNPDFVRPGEADIAILTEMVHQKAAMLSGAHAWLLGETAEMHAVVDASRLTQAWLQLADNAAKYAPTFTAIEIGSTLVTDASGRPCLDLWVLDEGDGIPLEAQERIFERFARVQEGRGIEGSGLGLSIVRAIAEAHGGTVALNSTLGVGSRFAIRLDVAAVQARFTDAGIADGAGPEALLIAESQRAGRSA